MDGAVKVVRVWFGPDYQIDKNWSEVTDKLTCPKPKVVCIRVLSLLERA